MKRKIIILLFFTMHCFLIFPQENIVMSLDEVIETAVKQSLDAFKAKNMYLASYWDYRAYKAEKLPFLNLNINPIEYNRTMTKRYDFENNVEIFREQKTINSFANLSLTQNIPFTGGKIYIDTDLSRLVNFGNDKLLTYNATIVRLGLVQSIFGFNNHKWTKKISPLKFEKAKKEYIYNMQEVKLKAVELYFNLLSAYNKYEFAEKNIASADTLYKIGKKKFDILSVKYQELLELELRKFNADIQKTKAKQDIDKANLILCSFLGIDKSAKIKTILPEIIKDIEIDFNDAAEKAKLNNPQMLEIEIKENEADRKLDKAIKESRFNANIAASYGLNQQAQELKDAYHNPLDQQVLMLSLQIPLVDWGRRKGKKQMARKYKEITDIESAQRRNDFEQEIILKVFDYNIQNKIIISAEKADEISKKAYKLTRKSFLRGEADVLKLNNAMLMCQEAEETYLNSIFKFFKIYFEIQKYTLYDYKNMKDISVEFEKLIDN